MTRIDYYKVAPEGVKAVRAVEQYVRASELEPALIELVKVRASLMNGCAYCVDLHTKDARAKGETEQRLFAVPVWRETPFFSPRERAALALDRGGHRHRTQRGERRSLRRGAGALHRQGTSRLDRCRYRDQRMEPSRRDVPARGGQLQACSRHHCGFRPRGVGTSGRSARLRRAPRERIHDQHKGSINPATGEVIGRYALAGEDEAREAAAAALRTFRETNWKNDRALRSRVLHEMAERFEARAADLI